MCGSLLSLCCRGKPQERVALWRETFESSLGSSKLSPFSKMVRSEGHTDHKGEWVCVGLCCLSAVEGGKPQERVALWRETFESWLGSSKLSPFSKMVRSEGHTDHKGECVCGSLLSLCCRGKPQERVALWRETFESSSGSSKLSPFFSKWYVLKFTPTTRASVCVVSAVEARKAEGRAPQVTGERQTPF